MKVLSDVPGEHDAVDYIIGAGIIGFRVVLVAAAIALALYLFRLI